MDHITD